MTLGSYGYTSSLFSTPGKLTWTHFGPQVSKIMWLHSWTISTPSASSPSQTPCPWAFTNPRKPHNAVLAKPFFFPKTRPSMASTIRAQFSEEITQLVHNKVKTSAGYSLFFFNSCVTICVI